MSAQEWLDDLVGKSSVGGCDDCAAVQTMSRDEWDVYHLLIEHDPTCPTLARIERSQ